MRILIAVDSSPFANDLLDEMARRLKRSTVRSVTSLNFIHYDQCMRAMLTTQI